MKTTKVIMIMNMKGGTGKTTSVLSLGAALANDGKKVLLVDTDPQESLTLSLGIIPAECDYTLMDALLNIYQNENTIPDYGIMETAVENLYIIPGSENGEKLERALGLNPGTDSNMILQKYVEGLRGQFDYILIDSGPSLRILTVNGLVAADSVIVPCEPEPAATEGLQKLISNIFEVKRELNHSLALDGILITKYDSTKKVHKRIKKQIHQTYGKDVKVFDFHIPYSAEIINASEQKKDIYSMENRGAACMAYEMLAGEVDGKFPEIKLEGLSKRKESFIRRIFGKSKEEDLVI